MRWNKLFIAAATLLVVQQNLHAMRAVELDDVNGYTGMAWWGSNCVANGVICTPTRAAAGGPACDPEPPCTGQQCPELILTAPASHRFCGPLFFLGPHCAGVASPCAVYMRAACQIRQLPNNETDCACTPTPNAVPVPSGNRWDC